MKIDLQNQSTCDENPCLMSVATLSGYAYTEDIENIRKLDVEEIDASDVLLKTDESNLKSIKHAKVFKIPESLSELGRFALSFSPKLEKVIIPKNTTKIGERAFSYCEHLRNIEVDKNNKNFTSINGVLFSKDKKKIIRCPEGMVNTYTAPEGVEEIADYAFYGCNGLKSVILPQSVKKIEESAFQQCEGLQKITIPDNVTSLEENIFFGCTQLKEVNTPANLERIDNNAFFGCTSLENLYLPNTITDIKKGSFEDCYNLARVTIAPGGKLQNSGNAIIRKDKNMIIFLPYKELNYEIEEGITTIGPSAFEQTAIKNITFSEGVKKIKERAFRACYNLTGISLPSTLSFIDDRAFDSCVNLFKIKCTATTPPVAEESAFNFLPIDDCEIMVPPQSVSLYKNCNGWKLFKNIIPCE